jgi:hypothetical protein
MRYERQIINPLCSGVLHLAGDVFGSRVNLLIRVN